MTEMAESMVEVVSATDPADSTTLTLVCGEAVARVRQTLNPEPAPRDNAGDNCRRDCLSPHSIFCLLSAAGFNLAL